LLWLDAHTVTEAANGIEALKLFGQSAFDVVITDFEMPEMSGDELVASIRSRSPLQPVILITACSERFLDEESPFNVILGKPFGVEELRKSLAALCSSK
jgi:two-component system chemotaxis response regulator CheY